jgi:outer membrane lipoprotein SlyB
MKPLALPLLVAALLLGGCYNPRYPSETPGTERQARTSANTVTNVYRTGPGTIETVNRSPSPSAVAGATNVRNDEVLLRMDDGTRQIILMPAGSTSFNAGDRVEVTSDRRIERR